jgi:hypothetical protein
MTETPAWDWEIFEPALVILTWTMDRDDPISTAIQPHAQKIIDTLGQRLLDANKPFFLVPTPR